MGTHIFQSCRCQGKTIWNFEVSNVVDPKEIPGSVFLGVGRVGGYKPINALLEPVGTQ